MIDSFSSLLFLFSLKKNLPWCAKGFLRDRNGLSLAWHVFGGQFIFILGERGEMFKFIIFSPPCSLLPSCSQPKVIACFISPVTSVESASEEGRSRDERESEGMRSGLCFVPSYQTRKAFTKPGARQTS